MSYRDKDGHQRAFECAIGNIMRWGGTTMLLLGRKMTAGGEKWECFILEPGPGWEFAYPSGKIAFFRDIDFTEKLG